MRQDDGIFEAGENIPGLRQWGEKGIQGAAPINAEATPESVATTILKEAARHARNRPHDDMTVVAIQVR